MEWGSRPAETSRICWSLSTTQEEERRAWGKKLMIRTTTTMMILRAIVMTKYVRSYNKKGSSTSASWSQHSSMVSQSTARPGWFLHPAGTDGRTCRHCFQNKSFWICFLTSALMDWHWLSSWLLVMCQTFLVTTSSQISSRLGWGEASASNGSLGICLLNFCVSYLHFNRQQQKAKSFCFFFTSTDLYGCAAGASARLHLLATSQRTRPQAYMSILDIHCWICRYLLTLEIRVWKCWFWIFWSWRTRSRTWGRRPLRSWSRPRAPRAPCTFAFPPNNWGADEETIR